MNFKINMDEVNRKELTALIGEEIHFELVNLPENREITVHLHRIDEKNRLWYSQATYLADDKGMVTNSQSEAIYGNYSGVDPAGLFWSMELVNDKETLPLYLESTRDDQTDSAFFYFNVEFRGQILRSVSIETLKKLPEVSVEPLKYGKLVGNFYYPQNKEDLPTVIVIGGSEGGIETPDIVASLLASYGFAAMSLAYFGMKRLPKILDRIPLDYVADAITWLQENDIVDNDKIAMIGTSKGAELSILAASMFPISTVIAVSPSFTVFQSLNTDPNASPTSSWTYKGKQVPFTPFIYSDEFIGQFSSGYPKHIEFLPLYNASLKDTDTAEKAAIKVENIKGPILLVSSDEDKVWPSKKMCKNILDRLNRNNFPYKIKHINYEKAGHMAGRPGYMPWPKPPYVKGGTQEANGKAQADLWRVLLTFLKENLMEH